MSAEDVVELLELLEARGIPVVIDGGWGVDALLGVQTRPHADLDIAVEHRHVPELRRFLGARGYLEVEDAARKEFNFVLQDSGGRKLDVHSYTFPDYGIPYPPESLTGTGKISGHPVRCIAAEWAVKFHCQYQPDEDDRRDVSALCSRFGIALPELYRR
jgi:lincosamide nucleotidyltransferase A/C/D/E